MEPLLLKCLAAALLWTISVCFGTLLPYFLWKISPHRVRSQRQRLLSSGDSSEQDESSHHESEELIENRAQRHPEKGFCGCLKSLCKRSASCIRVQLSNEKFLSLINCMCGGVFLGVSLLDLVPQSRQAVELVLTAWNITTVYPVSEFMVSTGLLTVMIIENVITEVTIPKRALPQATNHNHEEDANDSDSIRHHSSPDIQQDIAVYRMYILIVTISLHSIFEGLAIGLQEQVSTLVQLLIAISVHKAVLSFSIGNRLFETLGNIGRVCTAVICTMMFCTSSPLGCFVGAFVSRHQVDSASSNALAASAVLQCLAAGTFLYVTFVEVIPHEFSHKSEHHSKDAARRERHSTLQSESDHDHGLGYTRHGTRTAQPDREPKKLLKLLALIFGFTLASALQFV